MRVLRLNKDSVMAMLEAFVHDPLINWRLLNAAEAATEAALARDTDAAGAGAGAGAAGGGGGTAAAAGGGQAAGGGGGAAAQHTAADFMGEGGAGGGGGGGADGTANGGEGGGGGSGFMPSPPQRGARERELREARDHLAGDASEVRGRGGRAGPRAQPLTARQAAVASSIRHQSHALRATVARPRRRACCGRRRRSHRPPRHPPPPAPYPPASTHPRCSMSARSR
jgi:hypothetical protein